ncbi:MAG: hypothetical protein ACFFG0_03625 [Candidatus Thorarchaeota archaeon]
MKRKFKDHEIAIIINNLRDIGYKYAKTQQLRTMIHEYLEPILKGNKQVTDETQNQNN